MPDRRNLSFKYYKDLFPAHQFRKLLAALCQNSKHAGISAHLAHVAELFLKSYVRLTSAAVLDRPDPNAEMLKLCSSLALRTLNVLPLT